MRKIEQQHIRKVSKVAGGRVFALTLPVALVRALGWREHQKVVVKQKGQSLIIRDWKK